MKNFYSSYSVNLFMTGVNLKEPFVVSLPLYEHKFFDKALLSITEGLKTNGMLKSTRCNKRD
ncbi:hypothetical protein METHB2_190044 [Candidatus Methylobacter favarea]|uniref:Uncharacterized protein n=1 Tax=Candidatus Methylobacter favarea TaxID=2707345 RepID=A0A8S0X7K9_9GAMM|nr:hypothetical protein METHB2_190044 [Candidatus Methylobacter favarea]